MTEHRRRRVVLGISEHRPVHLVDWAARLLRPADCVQVMEVYRPIPYAATDWQLPVQDWQLPMSQGGSPRALIRHQIATTAARLRRFRPDLTVIEELAGGAIDLALAEAAQIADLLMLGVPHSARTRAMLSRLLAELDCPVILIGPAEPAATDAVAAVLRGDTIDDVVLRAAFEQAQRDGCGLLVLKRWQPPLDGTVRYAEIAEQKMLDSYLAGWQQRYPQVGVIAELRYGQTLPELMRHAEYAGLLVLALPRPDTGRAGYEAALDEVIAHRTHPTMLIPEPGPAVTDFRPLASLGQAKHSV